MSTLEERKKRWAESGIPMPMTQMSVNEGGTSSVPVTNSNADKHAKLQAIKNGANRDKIRNLVSSAGKTRSSEFQALPEPKMKKNPNDVVAPDKKVPLKDFSGAAPISDEFAAMEAMMAGAGGGAPSPSGQINYSSNATNTTQPELSIDQNGYGPSFNPSSIIKNKREAQNSQQKPQQKPQQLNIEQQSFNFEQMQNMMEQIAKNTISEVLDSYTENNKKKLTYENYTKTKDGAQVIKTQDGAFYKLVPVRIKKS